MVSVNGITIAHGGWELFKDISFLVNPKERIGLVGKNGAGKSTLLKVIAGEIIPTEGGISKNGECSISYLAQQIKVSDTTTVFEEAASAFKEVLFLEKEIERLNNEITSRDDYHSKEYSDILHLLQDINDRYFIMGGANRDAEIEKTLIGLGFKREDFKRETREFSGGWRMRIELAKILLRKPSLMLLDEPTNHLDIESIEWLEEYLRDYRGAVIIISHDRKFLDNITTRTIEIVLGKSYDYKVSYSKFVELRRERRAAQKAAYDNQQKMIQQTEEFIERFRYKPSKSNQVQSRVKQLDKIDIIEIDDEDVSMLNMKFPPAPSSGNIMLEVKNAGKSFGDKHIFSGADFILEKSEKIALVGRNGEGKTTFAKMVIGLTDISTGEIRIGHNVKIGYYAQNQDDLMDGDFTVYDTLDRVAVGDVRTRLRDILGAFLFKGEDIDKKVKVLSGGERSRLAMARLMLEPYNLLILDEPTNHMDMRSKDILKKAINDFDGTVILVSHDREFLDGLVSKVYEFRDGKVKEHLGGIYDFLESRRITSLAELDKKVVETAMMSDSLELSDNKINYQQKKEKDRQIRKIQSRVDKAEREIERIEREISVMDMHMSEPDKYNIDISDSNVFAKYNNLKTELLAAMSLWEELSVELECFTE